LGEHFGSFPPASLLRPPRFARAFFSILHDIFETLAAPAGAKRFPAAATFADTWSNRAYALEVGIES